MVLCREGHPTAKPASKLGISARMAANAHSAGLPSSFHLPRGRWAYCCPLQGTRRWRGEVRGRGGTLGSQHGYTGLFRICERVLFPLDLSNSIQHMGAALENDLGATNHHSGTCSLLQWPCVWKAMTLTFTPFDPGTPCLDIYPEEIIRLVGGN